MANDRLARELAQRLEGSRFSPLRGSRHDLAKNRSATQRRVAGGSRERLYALIVPAVFDHSD